MSGLTRFVGKTDRNEKTERRASTPPPAQPGQIRMDRYAAQNLKFGAKKFDPAPAPTAAAAAQRLPSTVPAPGYDSNPTASRNTFPNSRFTTYDPPSYQRDLDDVTVDSDFDVTKSDINFEPAYEDGQYRHEDRLLQHEFAAQPDQRFPQGMPQHRLHHVHSQSPLIKPESQQSPPRPQGSGIVGRFHASQGQSQHPDLQLRSGQPPNALYQQMVSSKKRNQSSERPPENYQQQQCIDDDELEDTDEYELPEPRKVADRGRDSREPQKQLEIGSDIAETPASSPTRQRKTRLADRPQSSQAAIRDAYIKADYDDETLRGMKYSDLKSDTWDEYPNPKSFQFPAELQGPNVELGDKIKYYADKRDDDLTLFFEQLSTKEWEQAGDWLIDKFADLLKQLKEKRQEKRAFAEQFEAEIEAREKAVRGKSENLEKKFKEMKASGEDVLRGKMF